MRILIAEDDEFTRRLYKIIFSKDELKICVNGQEFIENYSKEYDVFIIDLKMPVQDGNSVLRFLKAVGNQTPIVICSAQPTITIDRGNILIIGKPIDSLTLRDKIYNYTKKINVLNKKSDLEHLELLTNNLPGVPTIENLIKPNQDNNKCVNYKAIKGTVFGIPIM